MPAASRNSSNPAPGSPSANVEKSRRKGSSVVNPWQASKAPNGLRGYSFESAPEVDDAAPDGNHRRLGSILGAELREDVLHATLDGRFGDR